MSKWNRMIGISLLAMVSVGSAFAGSKDATDAKTAAETAANATANASAAPAGANPSLTPVGGANVTALLGVLVMKGVLAPAEANAIRNAAPEAEFQLLVEALTRKGVVSAADLTVAIPSTSNNPDPRKSRRDGQFGRCSGSDSKCECGGTGGSSSTGGSCAKGGEAARPGSRSSHRPVASIAGGPASEGRSEGSLQHGARQNDALRILESNGCVRHQQSQRRRHAVPGIVPGDAAGHKYRPLEGS